MQLSIRGAGTAGWAFVVAVCLTLVARSSGKAAVTEPSPPSSTLALGVFVALGDSYTAGPAIPSQLPAPVGCLQSDHNYPHLVSDAAHVTTRRRVDEQA